MIPTRTDLIYEPKYSARYLTHIKELSEMHSVFNDKNEEMARQCLKGIDVVRKYNEKILEEILKTSKVKESIFI